MWGVQELSLCPVLSPGGLASAKDYPFLGNTKPHRCLAKKYKKVAWIQDFIMLQGNEQGAGRVETWAGLGVGGGGVNDRERQTRIEDRRDWVRDRWRNREVGGGVKVEPKAGGTEQAGPNGTFHPQQSPGTWPPKAPSL